MLNKNLTIKLMVPKMTDSHLRPVNTAKVAILFLNATNSLMLHRILFKTTETIEDDVSDLMALFMNGLVASTKC